MLTKNEPWWIQIKVEVKRQPKTELPLNREWSVPNDHKDNSQVCQMCGYINIIPMTTKPQTYGQTTPQIY